MNEICFILHLQKPVLLRSTKKLLLVPSLWSRWIVGGNSPKVVLLPSFRNHVKNTYPNSRPVTRKVNEIVDNIES